jgi:hypothetical protein
MQSGIVQIVTILHWSDVAGTLDVNFLSSTTKSRWAQIKRTAAFTFRKLA